MGKLAESYVEFVAKGLAETEAAIGKLGASSNKAHEATTFLSDQFKEFGKRNQEALAATNLQIKALTANSGAAKALMQQGIGLEAQRQKLVTLEKSLEHALLQSSGAFQKQALAVANAGAKQRVLAAENQAVMARMQANSKEAIQLAAAEMKAGQAADHAAQKLQLQARQLALQSGAFKEAAKAAAELARMEEKIAAQEMKVMNKAQGKTAAQAAKGGEGEAKFAVKTEGMPQAEKGIAAITAKMQKLQTTSLVVAGSIGGAVGMLTRAASAGTVEGEQLSKAYEHAGRVIGDMFAPYVRLATSWINKLSSYWKSLSAETKASVAKWAMLTAAVASFAAILPVVSAAIGAVVAAFAAIASAVGVVCAAIAGLIAYFGGVFDSTKSWEEVLATFIEFFLNVWSRAESAFGDFCSSMQSAYDSTMAPVLDGMTEGWNAVMESVGGVVGALTETIAGFFGVAIEDAGTFQGVMTGVTEAWMDLQSAAEAVIEALTDSFMWIYDNAVKPTIDFILDAFKLLWGYIKEVAEGIFGAWDDATGGVTDTVTGAIKYMMGSWKNLLSVVVSMVFTIVEAFATGVNKISELWWGMVNKLAKAAAWIMEKMGIISKETAEKMRKVGQGNTDVFDVESMRKKMDGYLTNMQTGLAENKKEAREVGKAINDYLNPAAGSELGQQLARNGDRAKAIARSVVGMVKGLGGDKGFKIKANVAFEGFQQTFDRLQLAFASNVGPNIEKAQLGEMKGINQNMQLAAGALMQIKDKIPAVR